MKLADKLVYLRKKQGLSQLKLAEMMNVSRQAVSRWETGIAVPSAENLKYLGNLYNVALDYLFNDGADELEENEKATDEIEDEIASTSDYGKEYSKKRKTKWVRPPAGKTVKLKFLGTGMISVMPVPLLAARLRGCSLRGHIQYVPSVCACRWTCQVHLHRPP